MIIFFVNKLILFFSPTPLVFQALVQIASYSKIQFKIVSK